MSLTSLGNRLVQAGLNGRVGEIIQDVVKEDKHLRLNCRMLLIPHFLSVRNGKAGIK